jgi:hypothetical protein
MTKPLKTLLSTIGLSVAALSAAPAISQSTSTPAPGPQAGRIQERFKTADTNKDGQLSLDEFEAMHNNMRGKGHGMGGGMGGGPCMHESMTRADVEKMGRPHALTRFDALDKNKDGKLSAEERAACPIGKGPASTPQAASK